MRKTAVAIRWSAAAVACGLSFGAMPAHAAGTEAFDAGMRPVLESYLTVQEALAADSMDGVAAAGRAMVAAAAELDTSGVDGEHAEHYADLPTKIAAASNELATSETLESAREALRNLSRPMTVWASMSTPGGIDVVFCSMAKASWVQRSGEVRNPYYGSSMLRCGELVGGARYAVEKGKGEAPAAMEEGEHRAGSHDHGGHAH